MKFTHMVNVLLVFHLGNNIGLRECHDTHNVKIICEACATSHPYLVSFPFDTIPICLLLGFFIYLSPLIFIYTIQMSPLIFIYTKIIDDLNYIAWFAILRNEEVVNVKSA